LEEAQFFHHKMATAGFEDKTSPIRKMGISSCL